MKKILFLMAALVSTVIANAQVSFSVNDVEICSGETVKMVVKMNNTVPVNGFQFDIHVPAGVKVLTTKPNKPKLSEWGVEHNITTNVISDDCVRFMVVSMSNDVLDPDDDEIMYVYLSADADAVAGEYTPTISGITVSHSGSQKLVLDDLTWKCNVVNATGIKSVNAIADADVYSISGTKQNKHNAGLSIIRKKDGKSVKVYKK